jgi:hypothetical protein
MRRENTDIMQFIHGIDPEFLEDLEKIAEMYIEEKDYQFSTRAKFSFGTLRATTRYQEDKQAGAWTERFDDVEIQYDQRDPSDPKQRWFGRILAFIRIGPSLQGAFVQSYIFDKHCNLYRNAPYDLSVYRFWTEQEGRNKFRLDAPLLRLISIDTILQRVHLVPDFSRYYNKPESYVKNWKNQRFLNNENYLLL